MLITTIVIFALASVLGIIIIAALLQNKSTPKAAVYAHGIVAATALVILIIYAINSPAKSVTASLVLFVIAALGGFVLFGRDMMKKPGPKALALLHAGLAVAGFIALIYVAFS